MQPLCMYTVRLYVRYVCILIGLCKCTYVRMCCIRMYMEYVYIRIYIYVLEKCACMLTTYISTCMYTVNTHCLYSFHDAPPPLCFVGICP